MTATKWQRRQAQRRVWTVIAWLLLTVGVALSATAILLGTWPTFGKIAALGVLAGFLALVAAIRADDLR